MFKWECNLFICFSAGPHLSSRDLISRNRARAQETFALPPGIIKRVFHPAHLENPGLRYIKNGLLTYVCGAWAV